jgi:hypothetical protein
MALSRIALALAVLTTGAALPAQRTRVPASRLGDTAAHSTSHPYTSALDAVANYESCGADARAALVAAMMRELRALESRARAKGLGPELDRVRRDYEAMLAVSTRTACGWGPVRALAGARGALADFRAWVAAQPARR